MTDGGEDASVFVYIWWFCDIKCQNACKVLR